MDEPQHDPPERRGEARRRPVDPPPRPIDRIVSPAEAFASRPTAQAVLLVGAGVIGMLLANSPWAHAWEELLHLPVAVDAGGERFSLSLTHWINDGLMGFFFFLVGLEIKRELLVGDLAGVRKAMLPAFAAVGGMAVPALVFAAINLGGPTQHGWGIPMATDIAFALGVLALLGDRIPAGLRVFLTALAIVDDIGAVLVIAIFYTDSVSLLYLGAAGGLLLLSIGMNRLHVRAWLPYFLVGTVAWAACLQSGVHPTVAALLVAFTIPARTRIHGGELVESLQAHMEELAVAEFSENLAINTSAQQRVIDETERTLRHASAPVQVLERRIEPFVAFLVLPVFALANAGVPVDAEAASALTDPLALGIAAGLILGKPLGVTLFSWLALRTGLADRPEGVRMKHVFGASLLAGVGFTMSLFITGLAFESQAHLQEARLAILSASVFSGVLGYLWLRRATREA